MSIAPDQLAAWLAKHPRWTEQGGALVRLFEFGTFPDAIAFVTRLAFDAEADDHHPDVLIRYRKVTVTWTTHSDGGVTTRDLRAAEGTDGLADRFGAGVS
jgi:4a-hydroxytetrahydrobiopterin dehydratase